MRKLVVYFLLLAFLEVSPISGRGTWNASVGNYEYFASPSKTYWSYNSSLEECRRRDGELALITSAEIQSFLNNLVTNGSIPYAFYIGLQDLSKGGTFVWDDGEALSYTNWATNEPNSAGAEKCVVAGDSYTYYDNLKWNDFKCDAKGRPTGFFCQRLIGKIWTTWGEWSKCLCPGQRQRVRNCTDSGRLGKDSCTTSGEPAIENGTCWTPECNITTPAVTTTARPLGRGHWFAHGSFEYHVSASTEGVSYIRSQTKCKNEGGELALVKSVQVQSFISSLVSENSGLPYAFYIGLKYDQEKNGFFWSDGSPLEYNHWETGEPNRNITKSEDCVGVGYTYNYREGLPWYDYACEIGGTGKKGRVCQRRIGTYWGTWSAWSLCNCSVTNQSRNKTCLDTAREGPDDCLGSTNETRQCPLEPSCYTTEETSSRTDPSTAMELTSTITADRTASTEKATTITLQMATTSSTFTNDQTTKIRETTSNVEATTAINGTITVGYIAIPAGATPMPADEASGTTENSTNIPVEETTTTISKTTTMSNKNATAVNQTTATTEAENVENAAFPAGATPMPADEASGTTENSTNTPVEETTTTIYKTTTMSNKNATAVNQTTATIEAENVENTSATDNAATFGDIVISASATSMPTYESSAMPESLTSAFGETMTTVVETTTTLNENTTVDRETTITAEYVNASTLQHITRTKATSEVTISMEQSTVPVTVGMVNFSATTTAGATISTSQATTTKAASTAADNFTVATSESSAAGTFVGSSRPTFSEVGTAEIWSTASQDSPVTSEGVTVIPPSPPQASFVGPVVGAIGGCFFLAIIVVASFMFMKRRRRKRGRAVITTAALQLNSRRQSDRSLTEDERLGVILEHFPGGAPDGIGYGAGTINQTYAFLNDERESVNVDIENEALAGEDESGPSGLTSFVNNNRSNLDTSEKSTNSEYGPNDNAGFLPDNPNLDHIDVNGDTYAVVKRTNKSSKSLQISENLEHV